jgi:hypothetical protein
MAFESISYLHEFRLSGFPDRWLPLVHLYDPDLPLFPLLYFHVLNPQLPATHRAGEADRAYGYVQRLTKKDGEYWATVCLNKNLTDTQNECYRSVVENEVRERIGLGNPVSVGDVTNAFSGDLAATNALVTELWYQVVDRSFGKMLPFGRIWDGTLGLVRIVASWYSEGGRKGELIQTHCFATDFGERIQTSGDLNVDFYLLPTFAELTDLTNPLGLFPSFSRLVDAANYFVETYCSPKRLDERLAFSTFDLRRGGFGNRLDTDYFSALVKDSPSRFTDPLFRNYGAFNRGPQRSVIFLLMLSDLRHRRWSPSLVTAEDGALIYADLGATYQSPKVIHLYAQQAFGNVTVLPMDNWIETFLWHPFAFRPKKKTRWKSEAFNYCTHWGKVERLIWLCAQARKVHSSVCSNILWCVRFGGREQQMRGANPLSCKLCAPHIRNVCPGYAGIRDSIIRFNARTPKADFRVVTSGGNSRTRGQTLVSCESDFVYDEYSTRDEPNAFVPYPCPRHKGENLSVADFISRY